jgi:RHS repeat-associated protein
VGNRSSLAVGSTTSNYTYASNANRITAITNTVTPPSAPVTGSYLTNAFHQRVQKVVGSTTTQFVHDQAGHLIAEANGSGTVQKEYIWLDDLPVAMVDSTGTSPVLYFIHTDQLGTPQKLTDGSLNVVWDGVFDPFGNPAPGASLALTNLRFPGQYADAESGLNQNWNRDYDPTTGRYIQSDPIGLLGGINTYVYVFNSPIDSADPTGEYLPLLAILPIIGGVAGGIADVASASPCENLGAAFVRGFVSGAAGTLAGMAAFAVTKNPYAAGAASGAVSQGLDQAISGQANPVALGVATAAGAVSGGLMNRILPTVGRLPKLTLPRTAKNFGPNSLRLVGQEGGSDALSGAAGLAVPSGPNSCGCQL